MKEKNRRILIIDDNRAIHDDVRKLLVTRPPRPLAALEATLFGDATVDQGGDSFEVDSAYQGEVGVEMVRDASRESRSYAMAMVDMRMPPGWDGLQTIAELWRVDPALQVVLCTAYSDASWEEISRRFGTTDRLLILKKPFDMAEVCQLACALTEKWHLGREATRATSALAKSLALARGVQEAVLDGILVVDEHRRVATTNRRFLEMWQLPATVAASGDDEALLRHVLDTLVDPDEFIRRVTHLYDHPEEVAEEEIRLKSGRVFNRWTGPVRGPDGTDYGRVWCFRDVTERHKIEADRAVLTDRMASMGRLAAGVGHEINNPLAYAMGSLDWLAQTLQAHRDQPAKLPVPELLETVETSREGLGRIRVIVRDLQTLARADEETLVAVDVEQVVEQAIQIAANEVKHRARLVRRYGAAPRVRGNVARLGQVFLNLLLNAVHAIPEGRAADNVIQVAISGREGDAVIEVSDSGVGVPPEHLERIFDLFFTTKRIGVGTGLGLSICHGIVKQHGGTIAVRSRLGEGSTFSVTLPGYAPVASATAEPMAPRPRPPRARVLVIDDEPAIARIVARQVGLAHEVVATTAARDAMARLAQGEVYDVILCDLMMSDLTGMDVYEQICRDFPKLAQRVVFMTGGAFTERAEAFLASVANPFLSKPFSVAELTQVIERVASGRDG